MYQEKITTYRKAMEYKQLLGKKGIVPGLGSIERLTAHLGNPQEDLFFVHIAGTNGKGSVLSFLSSVLQSAGYRVGRYSSPAVFSQLEQFKVNGRAISRADFARGMEEVRLGAEQMEADGHPYPTVFEAETALAFWYFKEKKCDIVVLETGMGGALDATNIVNSVLVSVLTPISSDHMGMLGESLSEIARQKAGIIKKGAAVVSAHQEKEVMEVIEAVCRKMDAPLFTADVSLAENIRYGVEKQRFDYKEYKKLGISLAGSYQIENAVLAVEVIRVLSERGFPVTEKQLQKGLREAVWNGRFTVLSKKPYMVIDGAHNEAAARRLNETMQICFPEKRKIMIMGVLKDKEYEKIAKIMTGAAAQVITVTPPENPRALPAYELAGTVKKYNPNVTAADSLQEAVEMSYMLADKDSVILAFGSLSYLGRLSEIAANKEGIRRDTHGRSEKN